MIDEQKRKTIVMLSFIFIGIVIVSLIIWFSFFANRTNLPPDEAVNSSENESNTPSTPAAVIDKDKSVPTVKDGVTFNYFDELTLISVTGSRVDLTQFYLVEEAMSKAQEGINSYTLEKSTLTQTAENGMNKVTYTVKDNKNNTYRVELSYSSTIDTMVLIYDKNNNLVRHSPYDTHEE